MSDLPKPAFATPLNPRRRGIIVGASDGIGSALARKLVKEGYTMALLARRKDKLDALCAELNSAGEVRALPYAHDVSNYKEIPGLLSRIVADGFGRRQSDERWLIEPASHEARHRSPPAPF